MRRKWVRRLAAACGVVVGISESPAVALGAMIRDGACPVPIAHGVGIFTAMIRIGAWCAIVFGEPNSAP